MPGNDSFTKLLLHGNGTDGSTTITDSSSNGYSGTAIGNAQIDTAQSKFGGASILMDGTGDRVEFADQADWDFDAGDFTIDLWVRLANTSGNNMFCGRVTNSNSYFYFGLEGTTLRFRDWIGSNNVDITRTVTISTNTWYHFAISRSGNSWRLFQDGVQQGSTVTSSATMTARAVKLDIGAMTENASYVMNGWIEEFRWSKGVARYTANFTPETTEYDNVTNDSFSATVLDAVSDVVAPSVIIDCTVSPSVLDASSEVLAPDVGNIEVALPSVLDASSEVVAPTVRIDCTVTPSVLDAVSSILSPTFPGLNGANLGTRILSLNPLLFVSNTSPARLVKADTTDPENLTWESVILTGIDYAIDSTIDELSEFIYIGGANGLVVKVEIADLSNQTVIDLSDTDSIITMDHYQNYGMTFAGTDNNTGELYIIDERENEIMDSRLDVLLNVSIYGDIQANVVEAKRFDANIEVLGLVTATMRCDFKCLTNVLDQIVPIKRTDFHVYLDSVELSDTDIDLASINITHNIGEKSTATFNLTRKHDRLNTDLEGNVRPITNQNVVDIYIQDRLEFTGKISTLNCNYGQSEDDVSVEVTGDEKEHQFNFVNLSLPGLTERLSLYHVLLQNPRIYNPFIDPDDETPLRYKGVTVNLGQKTVQSYSRWTDFDSFGTIAQAIQDGTFVPRQNWTYFWSPTVTRFGNYQVNADSNIKPGRNDIPFHTFTLPSFNLPVMRISATNSPFFNLGETSAVFFSYIGTSLAPVSEDLWILTNANHRRQRQFDDIITELGTYSVGEAPFKQISVRNNIFEPSFRWEDGSNGLYSIRDAGYNFLNYAKRVADLEYQKLLNINGDILPETSCSLSLTIDGYYYHGLKLLTRFNIDNTTEAGIYVDNNGFPVSIKSIVIDSATMKTSITADNLKSKVELEALDGLYPDEDSPEFNTPETSILVALKSDMRTRLQVE